MSPYLLIEGPGVWAYQYPLEGGNPVSIGRAPKCEVKLNDFSVSGRHALLIPANGQWVLRDNASSNGTFVNGAAIQEVALRHGDTIRIGKTELAFYSRGEETTGEFIDRTQVLFLQQEQAIRGAIRQAAHGGAVAMPAPSPLIAPAPGTPTPNPAPTLPPTLAPGQSGGAIPVAQSPQPQPVPPSRTPPPGAFQGPPRHTADLPGIPDLPDVEPAESMDDFDFDPDRYASHGVSAPDPRELAEREMMLWVAERTADMLAQLATLRGKGRRALYERALQLLREAIGADNGFLMVADGRQRRWVIRAWVGDAAEWTGFEKQHPVPLTVANQAFKEDRVVSNAYGSADDSKSESMLMLSVHCYIAVPLYRSGLKEGVLYFDTRRSLKQFAERDVKLIDRVGSYLLQMESPSQV